MFRFQFKFRHLIQCNQLLRPAAMIITLLGISMLSGCAGYLSQSFDYQPTDASALKLSVSDAKNILSNALSHCYDASNRYINMLGYRSDSIGSVTYFPDHYTFTDTSGSWYSVYYKDMHNIRMSYFAQNEWPDYFEYKWDGRVVNSYRKKEYPAMDSTCNMIYPNGPMPFDKKSSIVMDAILRLKIEYDDYYGSKGEKAFKKAVDHYLAETPQPSLPEEVKTYEIQAEVAVKRKNFKTAEKLYGKALAIAPWWAQGHFNRALILGALGATDAASVEMNRYIYLNPTASNVNAAKRKIAEWETPLY